MQKKKKKTELVVAGEDLGLRERQRLSDKMRRSDWALSCLFESTSLSYM